MANSALTGGGDEASEIVFIGFESDTIEMTMGIH